MTTDSANVKSSKRIRNRLLVRGTVQGVGFRPFVYRLAQEMKLGGCIANTLFGAEIEVEGPRDTIEKFQQRLCSELPPLASITEIHAVELEPQGTSEFVIRSSSSDGKCAALVLPDVATCSDCVHEIFDPSNRRYRYPFTNCTNCGPRYSIIVRLPYDRCNTTMAGFTMCPDCRAEYENPADRRFHAQPNACPRCGPSLRLLNRNGTELARHDDALRAAVQALREGKIVALKGIGGFQLLVDAQNDAAVERLRKRKRREEKPFAVMFPSLEEVRRICSVGALEQRILVSPESPIVLVRKQESSGGAVVAPNVAPDNPYLGVMLPYSPLHHLLLNDFGRPVVATSGNLTDEPICIATNEALERLGGIADFFLTHNRPIFRYVDDSVVRVMAGRVVVLRRARGFAPLPVAQIPKGSTPIIAFGAHLKNTVAVTVGKTIILSPHIGDLDTELAVRAHEQTVDDLCALYQSKPKVLVCDAHPDYASTQTALRMGSSEELAQREVVRVAHHHAHVLAAIAEHGLFGKKVLGVAWDGTGLGLDRTIWGSEFLLVRGGSFQRLGHFRYFRAVGGDAAMREPRRSAFAVLAEILGPVDAIAWFRQYQPTAFTTSEFRLFVQMAMRGLNSPWTCSAGRLFDAVASLLGLRHRCSFEGQAAMALEWLASEVSIPIPYPVILEVAEDSNQPVECSSEGKACPDQTNRYVFNWAPMICEILNDLATEIPQELIAARFHATLVEVIAEFSKIARCSTVVLTGGCFQNRLLTEGTVQRLEEEGIRVFIHERVPPNDGGVAVGQAVAAAYWHQGRKQSVSRSSR